MVKHAIRVAAIAIAVFTMVTTVPAGAATAGPFDPVPVGSAPCTGDLCLYVGTNFGGVYQTIHLDARPIPLDGCYPHVPRNTGVGSAVNKSQREFYVYSSANCSGTPYARIFARTANDDLGPTGAGIRSVRVR